MIKAVKAKWKNSSNLVLNVVSILGVFTSAPEAISTVWEIVFAVDGISSGITPAAAEIANKVIIEVDTNIFMLLSPFTQAF